MSRLPLLTVTLAAASLTGCSSLMNIGGASTNFACKAQEGVRCESISSVYNKSLNNELAGDKHDQNAEGAKAAPVGPESRRPQPEYRNTLFSGMPIRSEPKVVRLWIAPWKDQDGDLHDQSHVYLTVSDGDWLIEHNRRAIRAANLPYLPQQKTSAPGAAQPAQRQSPAQGMSPGVGQVPTDSQEN